MGRPPPPALDRAQVSVAIACLAGIGVAGTAPAPVSVGLFKVAAVLLAVWWLPVGPALVVAASSVVESATAARLGDERGTSALVEIAATVLGLAAVRLVLASTVDSRRAARARAADLWRANERLERFAADAAHELRAPLALMRSEIDLALTAGGDAEDQRRRVRGLAVDVERMSSTVSSLLVLARADAGSLQAARRRIDLTDLLELTLARWRAVADRCGVALHSEVPDAATLVGDQVLLERLLDNLVDNALGHTSAGGEIRVAAARVAGGWRVEVVDDGCGVPAALSSRVFERHVRGVRGALRPDGAGLGLALCAAVARAHGGEVRLEPVPRGARFVVELPDVLEPDGGAQRGGTPGDAGDRAIAGVQLGFS